MALDRRALVPCISPPHASRRQSSKVVRGPRDNFKTAFTEGKVTDMVLKLRRTPVLSSNDGKPQLHSKFSKASRPVLLRNKLASVDKNGCFTVDSTTGGIIQEETKESRMELSRSNISPEFAASQKKFGNPRRSWRHSVAVSSIVASALFFSDPSMSLAFVHMELAPQVAATAATAGAAQAGTAGAAWGWHLSEGSLQDKCQPTVHLSALNIHEEPTKQPIGLAPAVGGPAVLVESAATDLFWGDSLSLTYNTYTLSGMFGGETFETTSSGTLLPAGYIKSVREVTEKLRQSLDEGGGEVSKFKEKAEAAKAAIREYLQQWRGKRVEGAEEIDAALESALRELSSFYSKNGPRAALTSDTKETIRGFLSKAQAAL